MQRWHPQFTTLAVILLATFQAKAGEFDIIPVPKFQVPKLDPVDPIDKVGKIPNKPPDGVVPSGENKYIACWTWDVAKEPTWRFTQKFGDPRDTDDFTTYQAERYENGFVGKLPVDPKTWNDPEQRKKLMDTFANESVPKRMKQIADELELKGKADRAALIRKQIQFVQVEWVNVKPELPQGVKVSDGQPSKKTQVGYDDDFIIGGGKAKSDVEATLTKYNWRRDQVSIEPGTVDRLSIGVRVYSFSDHAVACYEDGWYNSGGPQVKAEEVFASAMRTARGKGTWAVGEDGAITMTIESTAYGITDTRSFNLKILDNELIEREKGSTTPTRYKKIDK